MPDNIQIPYETYQRLLNHLSIHAETDAWAKQLLLELQQIKNHQTITRPITFYIDDKR